jgi:hypothetical protein
VSAPTRSKLLALLSYCLSPRSASWTAATTTITVSVYRLSQSYMCRPKEKMPLLTDQMHLRWGTLGNYLIQIIDMPGHLCISGCPLRRYKQGYIAGPHGEAIPIPGYGTLLKQSGSRVRISLKSGSDSESDTSSAPPSWSVHGSEAHIGYPIGL